MPFSSTGVGDRILEFRRYFETTYIEVADQNYNLFNGASGGAIRFTPNNIKGNVETESFFGLTEDIIQERDIFQQTPVPDIFVDEDTKNRIKMHRRIGPWAYTEEEWKNVLKNSSTAGVVIGRQGAVEGMIKSLNTGILAAKTAIIANTALVTDVSAATVNHLNWQNLAKAERPFGDASHKLSAWVMHSHAYNDLYQDNLSNNERLLRFENVTVMRDPLGRIILVTDSPYLFDSSDGTYSILGLIKGAVTVGQNANLVLKDIPILGEENLGHRWQGEFSQTLEVHGNSWDEELGGVSPKNAAIGSTANWKPHFKSIKDSPGVILKVKGRE